MPINVSPAFSRSMEISNWWASSVGQVVQGT